MLIIADQEVVAELAETGDIGRVCLILRPLPTVIGGVPTVVSAGELFHKMAVVGELGDRPTPELGPRYVTISSLPSRSWTP